MKRTFAFGLFAVLLTGISATFAQSSYPYSDSPGDSFTEQAVTNLTDRGIVGGYPDGSFRPTQQLNRAEYMKIVMNLRRDNGPYAPRCFPDVPEGSWFEPFVCRAKTLGIVHGNPPSDSCVSRCTRTFNPTRSVNYAEALKVLFGIFDIPVRAQQTGEQWYAPYMEKALSLDLDLARHEPGTFLTRGNMAILVYNFVVYDAEHSSSSSFRSSSSSSVRSSSSSSSSLSGMTDTMSDTAARSQLLLLGEMSPILGAASFFSDAEPLNVTKIHVDFGTQQNDIRSLLVYDENRHLLGRAFPTGAVQGRFTLSLPSNAFTVPKRDEKNIYVRADIRSKNDGGTSQIVVQIAQFLVEGNGAWSGNPYAVSSHETFDVFLTSRAVISSITNAGVQKDLLIGGVQRTLGAFRFQGRTSDASARLNLTSITFSLFTNNLNLADVRLGADGTSNTIPCSTGSQTITCDHIDEFIGSLAGGPRTLTLYGDITVIDPIVQTTVLQVSLSNLGSAGSNGSIRFYDGSLEFAWVPLAVTSIAGTQYSL